MTNNNDARIEAIREKAEGMKLLFHYDEDDGIYIGVPDIVTPRPALTFAGNSSRGFTTADVLLAALDLDRLVGSLKTMVGQCVDGGYDDTRRGEIVQLCIDAIDEHFGRLE